MYKKEEARKTTLTSPAYVSKHTVPVLRLFDGCYVSDKWIRRVMKRQKTSFFYDYQNKKIVFSLMESFSGYKNNDYVNLG